MTVTLHELKQAKKSFIIWTAAIAGFLVLCIFLFPEMKGEMGEIGEMFSEMGTFTQAFGMDKINFGTLLGYYTVECGNVLGLGGSFFAALIGIGALAKEEKDRTSEYLFAHPVSRTRVMAEKLLAIFVQLLAMNVIIWLLSVASIALIGESVPFAELTLLHLANLFMQIELACLCFGASAFISKGSLGIGLAVAAVAYFLNITGNLTDSAKFLKYVTAFGYADGADIVADGLDAVKLLLALGYSLLAVGAAFWYYPKKDLK